MSGASTSSDERHDQITHARREFGWWGAYWGWLVGLFLLFATLTNLLQGLFQLPLLPSLGNTLDDFRTFAHWLLSTLFFDWIAMLIGYAWYGVLTLLAQVFADVRPWVPQVVVPDWYKDAALVSAVLSRATRRAVNVSGHSWTTGKVLLDKLTPEEREVEWDIARRYAVVIAIRDVVALPAILFQEPARRLANATASLSRWLSRSKLVRDSVFNTVEATLEGITFSGISDFARITINGVLFDGTGSEYRRRFGQYVRWAWFTLTMAILSSIGFFVWNGYALDAVRRLS